MKKIILSYFILLTGLAANAQNYKLSGKIADNKGLPLSFAGVQITLKDSVVKQTFSLNDGSFSLDIPPGSYTFLVKQLKDTLYLQHLNIAADMDLGTLKIKNSGELQTVTVTGRKPLIERQNDKLIFKVENSVLAQGGNALDVLQKSPELGMNAAGNIVLKNRAATILINGRQTNLSEADLNIYLAGIKSEDIKQIEIQDVAASNQDAAVKGGVINIILKNPKGFRVIANSSYTYRKNNYGMYNGGLSLNYGSEKWAFYLNPNYTKGSNLYLSRDGFNYNSGLQNKETASMPTQNNTWGSVAGVVFSPNKKNDIGIEGYFNKNKNNSTFNSVLNLLQNNILQNTYNNQSSYNENTRLWYITLNYTFKIDSLGSNLKFMGDVGRNNSSIYSDLLSYIPNVAGSDSNNAYNTNAVSDYYTLQLDWLQKLKNNWEISAGTKFGSVKRYNLFLAQNYDFNNDMWLTNTGQNENFDDRENILAGYFSISKKMNRHLLRAGLRVENTNVEGRNQISNQTLKQNYTDWFPNVYYEYDLEKNRSLSLSYQRSVTRPPFINLMPFVQRVNQYLYIIGNPYLQPYFTDHIEADLNLKNQSVSIYGEKTDSVITNAYFTDTVTNINYNQAQNYGNGYGTGIDYSCFGNIAKWLYAKIAGGVFYNSFKTNDGVTTKRASFYNEIYAQVKLPKSWLFEITSSYYYRFMVQNTVSEPQYRMDLSVKKTLLHGNLIAALKANDIFATEFPQNTSYYKDFTFDFYRKGLQRSFMLSIQYTFDNHNKINDQSIRSDNDVRQRL